MNVKYFGTDGIRGKSFEKLTAELAFKVGMSLKEAFNIDTVVIGHDTRDSSPTLAHLVASGAMYAGLDVLYAGIVSTPMIAYYSELKSIIGIMITASHNPYQDNGIKVFNKGQKSLKNEEIIIESYIDNEKISNNKFGKFILSDDITKKYYQLIDSLNLKTSNIKVIYDSANGANYLIANELMNKYFNTSLQISNKPNGKNINEKCGSTYLNTLIDVMSETKYDIGFAYDGDGDRFLTVDNNLKIYDGDFIIYVLATYLKENNMLNKNTVVLTKMSNPGILKALKNKGINYVLTDVGDKYVFAEMVENDYDLGGEASGHIIYKKLLNSGDGLLNSLFLLKILETQQKTLKDLTSDIELYPFKMINIDSVKKEVLKLEHVQNYFKEYQKTLNEDDLFLIRPSGTENLIRVTLSVENEKKLNKDIEMLVNYIKEEGAKI